MTERAEINLYGISFIQARNKLVEHWRPRNERLAKDPYVQQQMQGFEECRTFTSREEFEDRIEVLNREYSLQREEEKRTPGDGEIHYIVKSGLIAQRLSMVERVYECSRFFWEEKGPFDPEALMFLQHALDQPVWSDEWRFKWGVKPPIIVADDNPQKDLIESVDIGRRIKVSNRGSRPDWTDPNEGRVGEIIAIAPVPQLPFFGPMAVIRDDNNWIFPTPLGNVDILFGK